MKIRNIVAAFVAMAIPAIAGAQTEKGALPSGKKAPSVVVPGGAINISANGGLSLFSVLSNTNYEMVPSWAEGETHWFTVSKRNAESWKINADYWFRTEPRTGKMVIKLADGSTKEVAVCQEANQAADFFTGDIKQQVFSARASSQNSEGESIKMTYDGDYNTFYHSLWSGGSTQFPVTLTYTMKGAPHIDYINYVPRSHENGRFGKVTIAYSTTDSPNLYKNVVVDFDFGFKGTATSVKLGEQGIDNVKNVRFTVKTGKNNFVTCAEMEFYSFNEAEKEGFDQVFTNGLCYELKEGVTKEQLDALTNPFARQLAYYLYTGEYDTKYRVGEYEAYEDIWTLQSRLKTNFPYNRYENPTGIYFEEGDKNVIFAEGITEEHPVNLIIKDFGGSGNNPESSYSLKNGVNIIVAKNKGNSYVSYYTKDYKNAANVKLHFAMGRVCGYFDYERGDTNEDWVKLLNTTCSDMVDMRTKRIQVAFPTSMFKKYCPEDAVSLAHNIDSTIYYERDIMGLAKYGIEPKNRQFARKIWGGGMFADGVGAAAMDPSSWMKPNSDDFGFWGFGHELGHVNQINPGFKWVGCGETTNNVYSAWVEFKLGPGNYRLETENTGLNMYSGLKGGRFNSYLEAGVRQGISWQLQCGPDYGGVPPTTKKTVRLYDYKGHDTGRDTTVIAGNYDHFIKLCPLWQLQLYCTQVGASRDVYAKVFQNIRTNDYGKLTHGAQQLNFMKLVCDSTGLDFLPFFEKAGMFKPIKAYIEDYSPGWLIIDPLQIKELKEYVKSKGYKKIDAEVNYITALNWKIYKDKAPLSGTLNVGCGSSSHNGAPFVTVNHSLWKNVVAFETYDEAGNLLRITMQGLGSDSGNGFTEVMFPEKSAYIMAVGWDGTRMKCYEKQ